jgi:hypothetical protein
MQGVYIGIGASFNYEKSTKEADKKTIDKLIDDLVNSKECVSANLHRSLVCNSIDDLKGLYPIYDHTPMIVFVILNALEYNVPVAIVGSKEIKLIVEVIKDKLKDKGDLLLFEHEGLNPSVSKTKSKLVKKHNLEKNEVMLFLPIDLPFCYGLYQFLKEVKEYDFVYYLNALEKVFNGIRLFNRNYYDVVKDSDGKILHIKEANIMSYKGSAFPHLLPLFDTLYEKRKGGAYLLGFTATVFPKIAQYPLKGPKHLFHVLSYYLSKKLGFNSHSIAYSINQLDDLANLLINDNDIINRAKIKFHDDPFAVRDGDALHDIVYFRLVSENIVKKYGKDGLQYVFPYGKLLPELNNEIKEIKNNIAILADFPEFCQEKNSRLNKLLEYRLKHDSRVISIKDKEKREEIQKYRILPIFDAKGNFIAKPFPGDNIEATINFMMNVYMKRFFDDMERYKYH